MARHEHGTTRPWHEHGTRQAWLKMRVARHEHGTRRAWHTRSVARHEHGTTRARHEHDTSTPRHDYGTTRPWHDMWSTLRSFHNTTLRRKAAVDFCTTTSFRARQRSSCAQIQARPRTIALHTHPVLMVYARQAPNREHSDDTQQVLWPSCCVSLLRIKRAHDATSP